MTYSTACPEEKVQFENEGLDQVISYLKTLQNILLRTIMNIPVPLFEDTEPSPRLNVNMQHIQRFVICRMEDNEPSPVRTHFGRFQMTSFICKQPSLFSA